MIAFCISTAHLLYTGICMELAGGGVMVRIQGQLLIKIF